MATVEELQAKLDLFENDAAKRGFYTLNRIVNQQINFLNDFSLKTKISSAEKKDAVTYKNAKDLWENLPDMISSLNRLRNEMKIDGDGEDEKDIPKLVPISPQLVAKSIVK